MWCLNECISSPWVGSFPQHVHWSTSGGAIFRGAPPVITVAGVNTDSGALSRGQIFVQEVPLLPSSCWLLTGGTLYTWCVRVSNYSPSLLSPWDGESACWWWTMLLLCCTIRAAKTSAVLPTAPPVRQHVYMCWCFYVCARVCAFILVLHFSSSIPVRSSFRMTSSRSFC